jgi:hypothetical protein
MTVDRRFVSLDSPSQPRNGAGYRAVQGLWHTRADGPRPTVGVIATHYEVDFSEHYLAEPLAERGIGMLGWNTRYRGNGSMFQFERAVDDIGLGVRWLREEAKVDTVVLLGNSGGASLMAAYQSAAVAAGAEGRSPGDLFVSLAAHQGRPDVLTAWLDPSIIDESDPLARDPELDMFDARHGPPFSPEFVTRYRAAQVARNERISAWCRAELERLRAAGAYDRAFAVPGTWADLRFVDLTLDPSDRAVGCYAGDPRFANTLPFGLAATNTCRSWLQMWSLSDSPVRAATFADITVPSLVLDATGDQGCFPSDTTAIFDALGATDRKRASLPGDHYFQGPGQRDAVADLVAAWIADHT